jgi:ElaB/YqjD/DUF883 family membrane-anchored ribosome-binding protein
MCLPAAFEVKNGMARRLIPALCIFPRCRVARGSEPIGARGVIAPNVKEVPMAGTRKVGEKIPLAVVGKDQITEASTMDDTEDSKETTIAQLADSLKALKAQVEQLSGSLAAASGRAGKAVAQTAESATDTVTSTVRTYPFYSVLAASAAAFLIGRLTVVPQRGVADRAYDRLSDFASRLPPHLMDAVRSRLH